MTRSRRHALVFLVAGALLASLPGAIHFLRGQAAPFIPEAAASTLEPGLKLTITSGNANDSRIARMIALFVPEKTPPSAFIPPGAFQAVFEGIVTTKIRDEYVIRAHGHGSIKVMFGDQVALEASGDDLTKMPGPSIKLAKGKIPIRVEYKSPDSGDAWVRVWWTAKGSVEEPISPATLTHDASDEKLASSLKVREGREIFGSMRCANCHASDQKIVEGAMPELAIDAPLLLDAGARLNSSWIAKWVNDPHAMRADATMPKLKLSAEEVNNIAAYLATQGKPSDDPTDGDANFGARVYVALGCVGCHTLPDQQPDAEGPPRVSLQHVREKFRPAALREYLLQPEKRYKWNRMPNFHLSEKEAADVQTFLFSKASKPEASTSGDDQQGRELFISKGCLNCHDRESQPSKLTAPPLAKLDWSRGCVNPSGGNAPDFHFTEDQVASLKAFGATDKESIHHDNDTDFAQRQFTTLNCRACHNRDRDMAAWTTLGPEVSAIESGLPPEKEGEGVGGKAVMGNQNRPPLTFVGEKLRPEWTAKFIAGEISYKPRPWMAARMPSFPARAAHLATGLATEQGFSPTSPEYELADDNLIPIGQKLIGRNGGFSCISCHDTGKLKALSPFEAPAPNFTHVSERLRHDYYHRWVYNPKKIDPGTLMPQFTDGEGKTTFKDIQGGDARKQYEAIWQYLLQGEMLTPPE